MAENLLSDRQTEKCNESYYIFSAKLDAIFNPTAKEVKQCADWCSDYYNRDGFFKSVPAHLSDIFRKSSF